MTDSFCLEGLKPASHKNKIAQTYPESISLFCFARIDCGASGGLLRATTSRLFSRFTASTMATHIPTTRLDAIPYAVECVRCASEQEEVLTAIE